MPRITAVAGLALGASILVAACGGATATTAPVATVPATGPSVAPSSAPSSATAAKVKANTATEAELAAAFAAAGISNADRWAREVAEYRPYPDDPAWARLRQELGKYNIDPAVLEQIIAILEV